MAAAVAHKRGGTKLTTTPVFGKRDEADVETVLELVTACEERDICDPADDSNFPTIGAVLKHESAEWMQMRHSTRYSVEDFQAEVQYAGQGIWCFIYPCWQYEVDHFGRPLTKRGTLVRQTAFGYINRQEALYDAFKAGFTRFDVLCAPAVDLSRELPDGTYRRFNPAGTDDVLPEWALTADARLTLREQKAAKRAANRATRPHTSASGKSSSSSPRATRKPATGFADVSAIFAL